MEKQTGDKSSEAILEDKLNRFNPQYKLSEEYLISLQCRCSCNPGPSPGPYCGKMRQY